MQRLATRVRAEQLTWRGLMLANLMQLSQLMQMELSHNFAVSHGQAVSWVMA